MSSQNSQRGSRERMRRWLIMPFRWVGGVMAEVWVSVSDLCQMLVPHFGSGRRNRDFEKAGRESQRATRRERADVSIFRKGERERARELVEAERENRKFSNASSEEAIHYREQLELRKLDVSRGEIVNHLAKINAKHRESESTDDESTDDESTDDESTDDRVDG